MARRSVSNMDVTTASKKRNAWVEYYVRAEPQMDGLWRTLIWPMIQGADFSVTMDFACGHGRNSAKLVKHAKRLICVDVNPAAIRKCEQRFAGQPQVTCILNDGATLSAIDNAVLTFIYSFDSVVHFEIDLIRRYLVEFHRVMRPGATAFIHHSNVGSGTYGTNVHGRSGVSAESFTQACESVGFVCDSQRLLDWGPCKKLDCITQFHKL
ncbi:MAG TPA: class I SAM-dependent methyltransferase [Phycisphaerae bacterium]|nr:class I SAM-dependent methyltransferase [Phycisphaerae bacterium]